MKKILYYFLIIFVLPLCFSCNGKHNAETIASEVVKQDQNDVQDTIGVNLDSILPDVAENIESASEVKTPDLPANGLPTVLDFNAVWCTPCQAMKPMFADFEEIFDGFVNFVPVDIDVYPDFAKSYKVEAVPTFVFLNKDGVEVNRLVGAKRRAEMEQAIMNLVK